MALENPTTKKYYRVKPKDFTLNMNLAVVETWRDKNHRQSGGDEFDRPIESTIALPSDWLDTKIAWPNESIGNLLVKTAYLAMKNLPEFSKFNDV